MKLAFTITLILSSAICWACSCIGKPTVKEALKSYDQIFVGKVIQKEIVRYSPNSEDLITDIDSVRKYSFMPDTLTAVKYTFINLQNIKGQHLDTLIIYTGFGGGDCGVRFAAHSKYVVYAFHTNRKTRDYPNGCLSTGICSRTTASISKELAMIKLNRRYRKVEAME